MLGKDLYKTEVYADINANNHKALILFYAPLIGKDALYLYEYLVEIGNKYDFEELNNLLNTINYSIDNLERCLDKLNEYHLIRTYKKQEEDVYLFVVNSPLSIKEFIKDDLFVRDFILKTSGEYYQNLISELRTFYKPNGFDDISKKYDPSQLKSWSKEDETFLKDINDKTYRFDTLFDINVFLKDVSNTLFPIKYRTYDNLKEIAKLADLYNISYDKMRYFISETYKTGDQNLNLNLLKYKCQNAIPDYKYIENGVYDVPCLSFLMSKQEGKEVSPFDKKLIYNLANEYNLKPGVINVLLEHGLNNCDNRLLEKYLYPIASDLHRNNIDTASKALERLNRYEKPKKKIENIEKYDDSKNPEFTSERKKALMERRAQNDK